MYLAHQDLESVNIIINIVIVVSVTTAIDAVGEIHYGSQPICADSCEAGFLTLWPDAEVQTGGYSYLASFDCIKQCAAQDYVNSTTAHIHMLARKEPK